MDKLILKALELAGYKDANTLVKILNHTPNPRVSAEMLLGVYEPRIVIPHTEFYKARYNDNCFAEVTAYNELADTVSYILYARKTQQVWYASKEDKQNGIYSTERLKDCYDWETIRINGMTLTEQTKNISELNDMFSEPMTLTQVNNLLQDWDPEPSLEGVYQ